MRWTYRNIVSEKDVLSLISSGAVESKYLDFKSGEPVQGDEKEEKTEFAKDVSSFANSEGGTIIYGVDEDRKNNVFTANPFSLVNPDKTVLRLQQLIQTNLRPKIFGVDIIPILTITGKFFIAIHVNKSLSAPHMVAGDKSFSYRVSKNKQPMEVEDLRSVFLSTSSFFEKAEVWRRNRVIPPEQTHYRTLGVLLFIHCIPLGFEFDYRLPAAALATQANFLILLGGTLGRSITHRFNLDGFRTEGSSNEIQSCDSVQFFQNGQIEGRTYLKVAADNSIQSAAVEAEIMRSVSSYLQAQKKLDINPPVIVAISLRDTQGKWLKDRNVIATSEKMECFDRNVIMLPAVVVEDWPTCDNDISSLMKPVFDSLWNGVGKVCSPHFKDDGTFAFTLNCYS